MKIEIREVDNWISYRIGTESEWHKIIGGMYHLLMEVMKVPLPGKNETVQIDFESSVSNLIKTKSK